jgi:hypothetical protein
MISKPLRGIVHGNVIELKDAIDVSDGEEVEVLVRPVSNEGRSSGQGLLRTEGALANDPEWDAVMEEIHDARRDERRPQWDDA